MRFILKILVCLILVTSLLMGNSESMAGNISSNKRPGYNTGPVITKVTTKDITKVITTATANEWRSFTVTAFTLRKEECGKPPGHPLYGITASGARAKVGVTVATGPELPLGTRVIIPELAWLNGTGEFIVQDRGGLVKTGCIDVFFGDPMLDPDCVKRALEFGRRQLKGAVVE